MEAKKYFEEQVRMFDSLRICSKGISNCHGVKCDDCPLSSKKNGDCYKNSIRGVDIVEKWSKEHPQKTMLVDILEKHPNIPLKDGYPEYECPHHLGYEKERYSKCRGSIDCVECWDRPLNSNEQAN